MNVAVNIMQGPARALVADVVDAEYQQLGNAMVSCTMGTIYKQVAIGSTTILSFQSRSCCCGW